MEKLCVQVPHSSRGWDKSCWQNLLNIKSLQYKLFFEVLHSCFGKTHSEEVSKKVIM